LGRKGQKSPGKVIVIKFLIYFKSRKQGGWSKGDFAKAGDFPYNKN
jgi:hypothetical protein